MSGRDDRDIERGAGHLTPLIFTTYLPLALPIRGEDGGG